MKLLSTAKPFLSRVLALCIAGSALASHAHAQPRPADDWDKVVEAAKKEGEVILWGQAGEQRRAFWKVAFEKAYPGIKVNLYMAPTNSHRDRRFEQEVKGGVFKADVFVGGAGSALVRYKPAKQIRPIKPLLRPDILDAKHWSGGEVPWMDHDKAYFLVSDALAYPTATINGSVKDPPTSYQDLLSPKFDGKIVMSDPLKSGGGFAFAAFVGSEPTLGREFLRKFFANKRVIFNMDDRQMAEWVDSGRALVGINMRPDEIRAIQKLGGKLRVVGDLRSGGKTIGQTIGNDGILWLPASDSPHPNATRVYVNWFYSVAGQQAMVDALDIGSNVAGVNQTNVDKWSRPRAGVAYTNTMSEDIVNNESMNALRKFLEDVLAGS